MEKFWSWSAVGFRPTTPFLLLRRRTTYELPSYNYSRKISFARKLRSLLPLFIRPVPDDIELSLCIPNKFNSPLPPNKQTNKQTNPCLLSESRHTQRSNRVLSIRPKGKNRERDKFLDRRIGEGSSYLSSPPGSHFVLVTSLVAAAATRPGEDYENPKAASGTEPDNRSRLPPPNYFRRNSPPAASIVFDRSPSRPVNRLHSRVVTLAHHFVRCDATTIYSGSLVW